MNQESNNQQPTNQPLYPGEISPLLKLITVILIVGGIIIFLFGLFYFPLGFNSNTLTNVLFFIPIGIIMYVLGRIISKRKRSDILLVSFLLGLIFIFSILSLVMGANLWVSWSTLIFSFFVLVFINFQKKYFISVTQINK
ncbi:MAG: hypothetical protein ACNFW9_03315 [Candidatus Kerfeldbacteria bacterium]